MLSFITTIIANTDTHQVYTFSMGYAEFRFWAFFTLFVCWAGVAQFLTYGLWFTNDDSWTAFWFALGKFALAFLYLMVSMFVLGNLLGWGTYLDRAAFIARPLIMALPILVAHMSFKHFRTMKGE